MNVFPYFSLFFFAGILAESAAKIPAKGNHKKSRHCGIPHAGKFRWRRKVVGIPSHAPRGPSSKELRRILVVSTKILGRSWPKPVLIEDIGNVSSFHVHQKDESLICISFTARNPAKENSRKYFKNENLIKIELL
jgi:hypothetical protein